MNRTSPLYMLDTNTVSYLSNPRHPEVGTKLKEVSGKASVCISAVTEAELRFGVALNQSERLLRQMDILLENLQSIPWDSTVAQHYALLRAQMTRQGRALDALDMLIAAHALSLKATLVTHDRAFLQVPSLQVEDWMSDPITDA